MEGEDNDEEEDDQTTTTVRPIDVWRAETHGNSANAYLIVVGGSSLIGRAYKIEGEMVLGRGEGSWSEVAGETLEHEPVSLGEVEPFRRLGLLSREERAQYAG